VRGLQVAQPAVLRVRDAAAGQLQLQHVAATPGPEQHGLVAQAGAPLAGGEDAGTHLVGLGRLVRAVDQLGAGPAGADGDQVLRVPRGGTGPGRVGQVEDRLGGAVVADQPNHSGVGKQLGQVEDVAGAGAAEAVHGLGVVADRGQPCFPDAEPADDVDLQLVHVLVLVDEDLVEQAGKLPAEDVVADRGPPVEQQVVEVEQGAGALAGHVRLDHAGDRLDQVGRPGRALGNRLRQRAGGVHRPRVQVEQQRLARGAAAGACEALLLPDQVEQVGGVGRVEHGEPAGQAERGRVRGDDPVRDRVERAAPRLPPVRGCPGEHLRRRPPGEGEQQHAVSWDAALQQAGDPRGQRRRLAGPGAGEHEQRPPVVLDRDPLLLVQLEHSFDATGAGGRRGRATPYAATRRPTTAPGPRL
jgi:hypothetical protein